MNHQPVFDKARSDALRQTLREEVTASRTETNSRRHPRHHTTLIVVSAVVVALLGTGGTAWALNGHFSPPPTAHPIPRSTHRAPDPVPTASTGFAPIAPDQASLDQLWAGVQGDPFPDNQNDPAAWSVSDFEAAIRVRCYPQLTVPQRTDLDSLSTAATSAQAAVPAVVADLKATKDAYVAEATRLCM